MFLLDTSDSIRASLFLCYDSLASFGVMAGLNCCDGPLVEGRAVGVTGPLSDVEDCEGREDCEEERCLKASCGRHCGRVDVKCEV